MKQSCHSDIAIANFVGGFVRSMIQGESCGIVGFPDLGEQSESCLTGRIQESSSDAFNSVVSIYTNHESVHVRQSLEANSKTECLRIPRTEVETVHWGPRASH